MRFRNAATIHTHSPIPTHLHLLFEVGNNAYPNSASASIAVSRDPQSTKGGGVDMSETHHYLYRPSVCPFRSEIVSFTVPNPNGMAFSFGFRSYSFPYPLFKCSSSWDISSALANLCRTTSLPISVVKNANSRIPPLATTASEVLIVPEPATP